MKTLMLSNSDGRGGAYAAAYRLLQGLEHLDLYVQMLVGENTRCHHSVIGPPSKLGKGFKLLRPVLDALPLALYQKREKTIFSPAILPEMISSKVNKLSPDIINIHWINAGFLRIETLRKLGKPIVWTIHDMWPFTGGCHYDEGCGRYRESCGKCPQLASQKQNDLSRWVWRRKEKAWKSLDITIVTPSRWLAECAKTSSLFQDYRVEVIPNGLDTGLYKPIDKHVAKEIWNLPKNKKLILFGAMGATSDKRKGFQYLEPALKRIAAFALRDEIELIVFGSSKPANPTNYGLKTRYLGQLHDDVSLALIYSMVDVFVAPSIQDNLVNTVMEALACGTPCVAFNIGGMPDMIEHQRNGYLARPFESEDLAHGIKWVIEDNERWQAQSRQARRKIEQEFEQKLIAQRYLDLYNDILKKNSR